MKQENRTEFEGEHEEKNIESAVEEARRIFGIRPEATMAEIKTVARALYKRYHPDKNPGNEKMVAPLFIRVKELYEILFNEAERRKHAEAEALQDENEEEVLEKLGNVFLRVFGPEVDPITQRIIQAYQDKLEKQEEEKAAEVDIVVDKTAKGGEEPGGELDIKV